MEKSAPTSKIPEGNSTPRRRNRTPLILALILIIGVAGIVTGILAAKKDNASQKEAPAIIIGPENPSSEPETEEQEKQEEQENQEPEKDESEEEAEEPIDGKTPTNQDGNAATGKDITGVINYAEVEDNTAIVRVSIDQYLETGECLLEMLSPLNGDTYTMPVAIAPSVSTSTCGYDIPTKLLTYGKYDIKITVTSGDKQGVITGEIGL